MELVKTSYNKDDVVILLKDLSSVMKEQSTEEREHQIQSGVHYSEMLPQEKEPSEEYNKLYERALETKKYEIARGIAKVGNMIIENTSNDNPIIVSLARAGIAVGVLLKRYIEYKTNMSCKHYAISIIRDKGIDINAMDFIYNEEIVKNHNSVENIFFVDGWTGKGVIQEQLFESIDELVELSAKWIGLRKELYVLADPANVTMFCGTRDDYLLPAACLNSTVSGLISRTILNKFVDTENGDFHGAVYFSKFENIDNTNKFVDTISDVFKDIEDMDSKPVPISSDWNGMGIVNDICNEFVITDYKKVKPGIGETTRVLLRRIPWLVLINKKIDINDKDIEHILVLCKEKNVPVKRYNLGNYKVCGIIKELSADA